MKSQAFLTPMHHFASVAEDLRKLRNKRTKRDHVILLGAPGNSLFFFLNFIAQKVSNINLVTKDFKIVPLTNLLKLLLAGRVIGGGWGAVLLGLY